MRRILSARRRMFLAVALVPALMATMFGFGAGVANAATSTTFSIFTRAVTAKSGLPYKLTLNVFKFSGSPTASLSISLTRTRTTQSASLSQTHSYSFSIPTGDVTIDGTDLVPTKINTGTDLGKFGTINMSLKNPGTLASRTFRCPRPNNNIVLGTSKTRSGSLGGTFNFDANDNFFHTIRKSALPATVNKFTSTGRNCPGGGGGGCFQGFSFFASDGTPPPSLSLNASKPLSSGKANIGLGYSESDPPALVSHNISGSVAPSNFAVTAGGDVTIKGGALSPFVSGTIKFDGSRPHDVGSTRHCKRTGFDEVYLLGSAVAHFDSGGAKTMNSADFASLTKTKRV